MFQVFWKDYGLTTGRPCTDRQAAEAGAGIFPSASLVGEQLCRQGGLVHLGDAKGVTETYYAISVERRLTHPAVRAISEGAHAKQNFA